jgi:hypothetical protein
MRFFKFPTKRPQVCEQWVTNCANEGLLSISEKTLRNRLVCEKHFTDDCFTSLLKTQLKKDAVPTLLSIESPVTPIPNPTVEEPVIASTSFDTRVPHSRRSLFKSPTISPIKTPQYKKFKSIKGRKKTPGKTTPNKRRLLNQLAVQKKLTKKYQQLARRSLNKKITKEELKHGIQSYFSENVSTFFSMQLDHMDQTTKPYTDREKKQALAMRYVINIK